MGFPRKSQKKKRKKERKKEEEETFNMGDAMEVAEERDQVSYF